MIRERYSLKTKRGRYIKIKQGTLYGVGAPYGFDISFQEHPPGGDNRVHTHIWIENDTFPDLISELHLFVTWVFEHYPKKVYMIAMLQGWELNEEETEFEGPFPMYEFVVGRKLSITHIDHVCDWLKDVLVEFIPRMGMIGLFGDLGESSGG